MSLIFRRRGQIVRPKTYQNKVIEGNEDFITKELICQQYCLTSLGAPVWLFVFSHSKECADAEFQERIGCYDLNPGKAWELRKDLSIEVWSQDTKFSKDLILSVVVTIILGSR